MRTSPADILQKRVKTMVTWRKSSYSAGSGATDCVELADLHDCLVGIRDSKAPDAGHLAVGRAALGDLLRKVRAGRLDLGS
jgi:hypothetical protein